VHYGRENVDGVWSIQSKWTIKSKKEAMPHLKAEIRKEISNATAKAVDHLRIATNAELDIPQVLELEELAENTNVDLKVWHREALTIRIEAQPFLRYYFFGFPQYPKLVPWNSYFNETELDLLSRDVKLQSFDEYVNEGKEFLGSQTSSILLISSPGGYGKSHLLRAIANATREVDSRLQVWMIRGGIRNMEDAIQDEVITGRRYLLIFDDADRFPDEIGPLLSLVRTNASVKVIFAMRSSGVESLYVRIRENRVGHLCAKVEISDWKKEDLVALLRTAADQPKVEHESMIAALYPNPFLMVWIGRLIAKEPTADLQNMRRNIVDDLEHEAMTCLATPDLEDFLVTLSCIIPFPRESKEPFLSTLSTTAGMDQDRVQRFIDRMVSAKILRLVGNHVRFNPDMKGDLYLADRLEKITQNKLNALIQNWLPICPETLLTNLASAARYANLPIVQTSLSSVMRSWAKGDISPFRSRQEVVASLVKLADFLPEQCLDILDAYLQFSEKLTTDAYGPVLSKLVRITTIRSRVLEAILTVHTNNLPGTYDNYKPKSLIQSCVSPLSNSFQTIRETLASIGRWFDDSQHSAIELASAALIEVLAGTHEYTEWEILSMTFGERALKDTPEVRAIRDLALDILERSLYSDSLEARVEAITVAEAIGLTRMHRQQEALLPLSARITEERTRVTKKIGSMINPDLTFILLNRIEQLFLKWWAQLTPGTKGVEQYLEKIPRTPEYITFSYFASSLCVVEDFHQLKVKAPGKDRWQWFVHSQMRHGIYPEDDFEKLVGLLDQKYDSPEKIVEFLIQLNQAISNSRSHPPIMSMWAKVNANAFSAMRDNSLLWDRVPQVFRREIQLSLAGTNQKFLCRLAREVLSNLPDDSNAEVFVSSLSIGRITQTCSYSKLAKLFDAGKIERGLLLLRAQCVVDRVRLDLLRRTTVTQFTIYRWLVEIIERGSTALRSSTVLHLLHLKERIESTYLLVELMRLVLSKEQCLSDSLVSNLHIVIVNNRDIVKSLPSRTLAALRRDLIDKLRVIPRIDYAAEDLLEFACSDVDALANFIEYRIQESLNTKNILYDVIPFSGLQVLDQLMRSYGDYANLMMKFIAWCERGPAWHYHLQQLMRSSEQNSVHCQKFIQERVTAADWAKSLVAADFLPFDSITIPTFIQVADLALSHGMEKEIEELLHRNVFPPHAAMSKIGEPSPALNSRRLLFEQMRRIAKPGKLTIIIDDCIDEIDTIIQIELRADQEILNPRA